MSKKKMFVVSIAQNRYPKENLVSLFPTCDHRWFISFL